MVGNGGRVLEVEMAISLAIWKSILVRINRGVGGIEMKAGA